MDLVERLPLAPPLWRRILRMAAGGFNYLNLKVADLWYGANAVTAPATVYFGLSTAAFDATKTGATIAEAGYTSYARVAVTNNATNFPNATGSGSASKTNSPLIAFPQSTGGSATVLSAFTADASTLGNLLHGADVTSTAIASGDTPQIPASGGFTLTES